MKLVESFQSRARLIRLEPDWTARQGGVNVKVSFDIARRFRRLAVSIRHRRLPDLDWGHISHRRSQVLPPDSHGFDGENDSVGCESG